RVSPLIVTVIAIRASHSKTGSGGTSPSAPYAGMNRIRFEGTRVSHDLSHVGAPGTVRCWLRDVGSQQTAPRLNVFRSRVSEVIRGESVPKQSQIGENAKETQDLTDIYPQRPKPQSAGHAGAGGLWNHHLGRDRQDGGGAGQGSRPQHYVSSVQ